MGRAAGTYAIFETSQGNIVVQLFEKEAPKTVANFVGLAEGTKEFTNEKTGQKEKRPFYDGLVFHRVIPQFMIQGGCPHGSGMGGPGYKFADEFHPSLRHSKAGFLQAQFWIPEFQVFVEVVHEGQQCFLHLPVILQKTGRNRRSR